ncbi:M14 family zinc carboxypeptidase [Streptomyces sp. WAC08241]|uniref:M14 family zinc carboxypeptidase n=1 Tax=Streptomyces sp. WAC08241 TaxID=2487421 RepID=UPI00163BBFC4|nr:M14 family zinc carboxypeptidase [Streptomyces sp. WAC08241]
MNTLTAPALSGPPSSKSPFLPDLLVADYIDVRPPTLAELDRALHALADEHPDRCSLRTIGRSRAGRPLRMLTVPGGPVPVLVHGTPHANEPIGMASALALARIAVACPAVRERVTWHLVACGDPDGVALNEHLWSTGWDLSVVGYHGGMHRPAVGHQPEWGFPTPHYAMRLPETRALKAQIDALRPALTISMHNSDSAGAFYMTTGTQPPGLPELLAHLAGRQGLPVTQMPMDCIELPSPGNGVFVMPQPSAPAPTGTAEREWTPAGASSIHYTERRGGWGVFPEVPMWATDRLDLPAPAAVEILDDAARTADRLQYTVPEGDSPFAASVREYRLIMPLMARQIREHPVAGRDQDLVLLVPARSAGALRRHVDALLVDEPASRALKRAREEIDTVFRAWCHRAETGLRPRTLPLARTAGYQVETALALASLPSTTVASEGVRGG